MELRILSELLWGPMLGAFLACCALARLLHRCEVTAPGATARPSERAAAPNLAREGVEASHGASARAALE